MQKVMKVLHSNLKKTLSLLKGDSHLKTIDVRSKQLTPGNMSLFQKTVWAIKPGLGVDRFESVHCEVIKLLTSLISKENS